MEKAGSLLGPLVNRLGIADAVRLETIKNMWGEIFAKPVSLHTFPVNLKEGELLINVDSPLWLQQLSFYKEDIIKKLQALGIKTVRLRLGRILQQREKSIAHKKKKTLTESDYSLIENTVSGISDTELKDRIKKAIEKCLMLNRHIDNRRQL